MIAPHAAPFLPFVFALGFVGCLLFLTWYNDAWLGDDRPPPENHLRRDA